MPDVTMRDEAAEPERADAPEDSALNAEAFVKDRPAPTAPPVPETLEETGLSGSSITGLILKMLYSRGSCRGEEIARTLAVGFAILDDLLLSLQQRRMVEVRGSQGHGREGYEFALTGEGLERAREVREMNAYVGPAPVPLDTFRLWVEKQSTREKRISRAMLEDAFDDLVLDGRILEALGPAVNSGSSIFLHGAPGNGKTAIAERIGRMDFGEVYIPHAVDVSGEVMVLFDPIYHEPVEPERTEPAHEILRAPPPHDPRFVRIRRPMVAVGGELTMDQLDLQMDSETKVYHAPFQLKATHGVLVVDDFGRQSMQPHELLNRWIVPLEKGVDYLGLKTGVKFSVPFDCTPIFSTNLDPMSLVDEAFLRRIQFKIEITPPSRDEYARIFLDVCEEEGLAYSPDAVSMLFERYYGERGIEPRGCHPRDIVGHLRAAATFEGVPARLTKDAVDRAARTYFLIMDAEAMATHTGGPEE